MNGSRARRRVRWMALAAAIALGASAVVASAPETAGAAVAGPGIGSKEALAAPGCDPTTGRLAVQWYAAPSCVRPFEAGDDNGGATARGVTKDAIKVTVLLPPEEKDRAGSGAGIRNQATGEQGLSKDALLDHNAILSEFWQTWGRTVTFEYVEASGTDEASQRADAITRDRHQALRRDRHCGVCQWRRWPGVQAAGRRRRDRDDRPTRDVHGAGIPVPHPHGGVRREEPRRQEDSVRGRWPQRQAASVRSRLQHELRHLGVQQGVRQVRRQGRGGNRAPDKRRPARTTRHATRCTRSRHRPSSRG